MKRMLLFGLILFVLTGSALANGGDELLAQLVRGLEAPFRPGAGPATAITDLQAGFVQQAYLGSLDRLEEGRGRVAVKFSDATDERPPRFLWEYLEPTEQQIVSDGYTVWVYLPENSQVLESPLPQVDQHGNDDPLIFLTGLGRLSQRFDVAWASPAQDLEGHYRLRLDPRRPTPMIEHLELVVDRAVLQREGPSPGPVYPVREAVLFGPNQSRTHIRFVDVVLNQGMDGERFHFIVPDGVEVIRPDQQFSAF